MKTCFLELIGLHLLLELLLFLSLLVLLYLPLYNLTLANQGIHLHQEHLNKLRNQQKQLMLALYLHMVAKLIPLYQVLPLYLRRHLTLDDLHLELSLGQMPLPLLMGQLDTPILVFNRISNTRRD